MPSFDPNELMAEVRNGLRQPHGQDGVIGALEVLGKMRELRAVPLFKEALRHTNNGTRTNAALALYRCGDPAGLTALTEWVSDVYGNPKGAVQAMYKLAEIKEDDQATGALRKLQQDHGAVSLMFRGDQRPVSWIVDSLLGSASDGGTTASSTGAKQKASSGCFIATAACGDQFAPEVIALSSFRDDVLLETFLGRGFVRLYYAISPPLAALIAQSMILRRAAISLMIRPAVGIVTSFRAKEKQ
jgi:hypothetical protein